MTKHSRLIAAVLTILFALSACTALTVFAENDNGNNSPGVSSDDHQQGGNDSGNDSGYDGGNSGRQQDDDSYDDDSGNSGRGSYDYDDDDSGDNNNNYNYNQNQNNNRYSNSDYDEEYDYEGERSANGDILYVGGDQTYVPPETIPSTTAAIYDTSKVKVDENTLTNSDWADIKAKLTASNNAPNNSDAGDFAFIQQNTSVEDNGHWMLYLGFTLIGLGIIGFIFLILKASERRKMLAAATSRESKRPAAPEQPAAPVTPERKAAPAKKSGKRTLRYRDDAYDDDYNDKSKPKGGTRFSKSK